MPAETAPKTRGDTPRRPYPLRKVIFPTFLVVLLLAIVLGVLYFMEETGHPLVPMQLSFNPGYEHRYEARSFV